MNAQNNRMFTLDEAAVAYAVAAEHIAGDSPAFLNDNQAVIPVFVSMLFQSLEISIKHAGIESGLFTMQEARSRQNRSGHGVKELAALAVEKLGGDPFEPIVSAMTFANANQRSRGFISAMICGDAMQKTRDAYASRRLGYAEIYDGDFATLDPIPKWVESVKQTALGLSRTVDILRQWKASESKSKHFAIWLGQQKI